MQEDTLQYTADDGVEIFVYRWAPDDAGAVKAILHIAHGLAEHAPRYARLAGTLTAAGYVVYVNDHRGHGETAKTEADLGFFAERDGFSRCVRDLAGMIGQWKAQHPGLPAILLGHSMGSFFTQEYLYTFGDTIQAAVLSGSTGKPPARIHIGRVVARIERWRHGARGRSALLTQLGFGENNKPFEPARTEFDWLSRDPAEVDKYVADPLCGFEVSTQMWIDLMGSALAAGRPENQARIPKHLPVYIFSGDMDPIGGVKGKGVLQLADAYRHAGLTNVTCQLYPGGRHEMLNETNRDEVTADLLAWLDSTVATLQS